MPQGRAIIKVKSKKAKVKNTAVSCWLLALIQYTKAENQHNNTIEFNHVMWNKF